MLSWSKVDGQSDIIMIVNQATNDQIRATYRQAFEIYKQGASMPFICNVGTHVGMFAGTTIRSYLRTDTGTDKRKYLPMYARRTIRINRCTETGKNGQT